MKMTNLVAFPLVMSGLFSATVTAGQLSGTWRLEKSGVYARDAKSMRPNQYSTVQIVNGVLSLPPRCEVQLKKEAYFYSSVFQLPLKAGVTDEVLGKYLKTTFAFDLEKVVDAYRAVRRSDCSRPFHTLLLAGDRLLVVYASDVFYSYVRAPAPALAVASPGHTSTVLYKLTQLPFNSDSYYALCARHILRVKGVPQTTDKCAPVYFPYVARKNDRDELARLVGSHDYFTGRSEYSPEYANPFKNGLSRMAR